MNTVHFSGMVRYEDLGFSLHRVTPTWDYLPHTHDYHELEIVISGSAINSINGSSFPIGPGDVFIVGKGATHEISRIDHLELYNMGFNSTVIGRISRDLLQLPGFHALFLMEQLIDPTMRRLQLGPEALQRISQLLDSMYEEYSLDLPGSHTVLLSDFTKLVALLSRNYGDTMPRSGTWQMAAAVSKMEHDYMEPLSIADLAASVYLSERHFRRQFERLYQQTPTSYLLQLRLAAAARMLTGGRQPVTEIAVTCGFSDCNYFSRIFRREMGMTPTEYRAQNRSK